MYAILVLKTLYRFLFVGTVNYGTESLWVISIAGILYFIRPQDATIVQQLHLN